MRTAVTTAAALLLLATTVAAEPPAEADAIVGRWKLPDGFVVEVVKDGAGYAGKVFKSDEHPKLLGIPLLRGVAWDGSQHEWHGELYAIKRREWVPMVAKLKPDGTWLMTAGKAPFTKDLTWTRTG